MTKRMAPGYNTAYSVSACPLSFFLITLIINLLFLEDLLLPFLCQ
jgi:hypothetical protein